jgi:colicin import membrane protein
MGKYKHRRASATRKKKSRKKKSRQPPASSRKKVAQKPKKSRQPPASSRKKVARKPARPARKAAKKTRRVEAARRGWEARRKRELEAVEAAKAKSRKRKRRERERVLAEKKARRVEAARRGWEARRKRELETAEAAQRAEEAARKAELSLEQRFLAARELAFQARLMHLPKAGSQIVDTERRTGLSISLLLNGMRLTEGSIEDIVHLAGELAKQIAPMSGHAWVAYVDTTALAPRLVGSGRSTMRTNGPLDLQVVGILSSGIRNDRPGMLAGLRFALEEALDMSEGGIVAAEALSVHHIRVRTEIEAQAWRRKQREERRS